MSKNKKVFRKWLNKTPFHSTAFVHLESSHLNKEWPTIDLTISDCSRQVTLNFSPSGMTSQAEIDNARRKANILREALREVDKSIDELEKHYLKRKKKKKKKPS